MIEISLTSDEKKNEEMFNGENMIYGFDIGLDAVGDDPDHWYDFYDDKKLVLLYQFPSGRVRVQDCGLAVTSDGQLYAPMARYLLSEEGVLKVQAVIFDAEDPFTQEEVTIFDIVDKFRLWYDPAPDEPIDRSAYTVLKSKVYEFYINPSVDPIASYIDSETGRAYPDLVYYIGLYFAKKNELARVAFTGNYNDLSNRPSGGGGGDITVDSELSSTSENPVQNKVINAALSLKADATDIPAVDSALSSSSENPVQNKVIKGALDEKVPKREATLYNSQIDLESASPLIFDSSGGTINNYSDMTMSPATDSFVRAILNNNSIYFGSYLLTVNPEYDPDSVQPTIIGYSLSNNVTKESGDVSWRVVDDSKPAVILFVALGSRSVSMYSTISAGSQISIKCPGTSSINEDFSDVAFSGNYNDLTNKPTIPSVPTALSQLENDTDYITKPRTTYLDTTTDSQTDIGSGFVDGADHVYYLTRDATQSEITNLRIFGGLTPRYLNRNKYVLGSSGVNPDGSVAFFYNLKATETSAPSGFDLDDATEPAYIISLDEDLESSSGYTITFASSEPMVGFTWHLYTEGSYLTSHQSLSNYYTKSEVDSAISTAISGAIGGSY